MAFKLVFILCITITLSSAQWSWFRRATTSTLPPTPLTTTSTTTTTTTTTPRSTTTVAVTRPPVTKPPARPIGGPVRPIGGPARPNAAVGSTKPGACSPPTGVGVCIAECDGDSACRGDLKCCPTLCGGRVCSRAVTAVTGPTASTAGSCPKPDDHPGPWLCNSLCDADVACRAGEKCCENTCGALVCTAVKRPTSG